MGKCIQSRTYWYQLKPTISLIVLESVFLMRRDSQFLGFQRWLSSASKLGSKFLNSPQKGEESQSFALQKVNSLMRMKVNCQILNPVPEIPILTEIPDTEIISPSNAEETALLAEETLQAWEKMRQGAKKLMKMYPVRVCGYCPEVHCRSQRAQGTELWGAQAPATKWAAWMAGGCA
ncbi:hypothetical protein L1049_021800 [Liquidambar formosana]|uniref:Uncharacterized protein n=1 Tax=Liquidambar formosana TaxID=63359 RepID=A0AAP0RBE1_LIQFO